MEGESPNCCTKSRAAKTHQHVSFDLSRGFFHVSIHSLCGSESYWCILASLCSWHHFIVFLIVVQTLSSTVYIWCYSVSLFSICLTCSFNSHQIRLIKSSYERIVLYSHIYLHMYIFKHLHSVQLRTDLYWDKLHLINCTNKGEAEKVSHSNHTRISVPLN